MSIKGDEGDIIYREHEDRRKGVSIIPRLTAFPHSEQPHGSDT